MSINKREGPASGGSTNAEIDNPLMPDSVTESRYPRKKKIFPLGATSAIIVAQPDQAARSLRPALPVILITGRHEFAAAKHEAVRGGRRLFEKPFDRQELLAAIGSELRASSGGL